MQYIFTMLLGLYMGKHNKNITRITPPLPQMNQAVC